MNGAYLHIDLGASFKKLIEFSFTRYQGCLIEHNSKGYLTLGKQVSTMQEAKDLIDGAIEKLGKTISHACKNHNEIARESD